MVKIELVSSRVNEIVSVRKDKRTMGDYGESANVRNVRSDRGIRRKPEKVKTEGTGKRGRPRSHEELRPMMAQSLRDRGLIATQNWLSNGGIKVSLTLLNAVAAENGIIFAKGRPRKTAA
jgi:hypothetical protein